MQLTETTEITGCLYPASKQVFVQVVWTDPQAALLAPTQNQQL